MPIPQVVIPRISKIFALGIIVFVFSCNFELQSRPRNDYKSEAIPGTVLIHTAMKHDLSGPLLLQTASGDETAEDCAGAACGTSPGPSPDDDPDNDDPDAAQQRPPEAIPPQPPAPTLNPAGIAIEQTSQGSRPATPVIDSFDGLGAGFTGPQGTATFRSPSDSSLATGPDHVIQIVNSRIAIYSKKGKKYDKTGTVLYGAVATKAVWAGFGGVCEARNSGDAVVRYDQLAGRWLIVMPMFSRIGPGEFPEKSGLAQGEPVPPGQLAKTGEQSSPGGAAAFPPNPEQPPVPTQRPPQAKEGVWAMCYALSTGPDPLGTYYRYAFERPLFPDYPRPAVWPDGYYVPTSAGDDVIKKQVCIVDRAKMLLGQPATEQCILIDGVNFLNSSDIDGQKAPPMGTPNITMAAGGTQLKNIFDDDGIYYWKVHVDWSNPANTKADGPVKINVAPYHYLCNGQLSSCVPQPDTERRLDSQGDKIMQRLVYRKVGGHASIVAAHSVATQGGGGGVRWYEFRLDKKGDPNLYQQGTYAPEGFYRWMPSIAMDKKGDIGIGYSFGGSPNFTGQRFAARRNGDPKGRLNLHESVLATGEAPQTNTLRWEDYVTTAMDPSDDCTFWYVGDYMKVGDLGYRTRIGSFRLPNCKP
jgi:hypothetical protein